MWGKGMMGWGAWGVLEEPRPSTGGLFTVWDGSIF